MRADKWSCLICAIISSLFFFTGSRCVEAAQFSADMVQRIGEKSRMSKIYVKDSKYRMEEKEDGQQVIIIVDQDAGVTRVLVPAEKKYKEMKSTDMGSLMNDPIQAAKFSATKYEQKPLGVESISGFTCEKSSLYFEDQLLMTQWVSKKLMFHIKIVIHGTGGRTVELENIKEGPINDVLFQVPVGYAKKEDPRKKLEREEAALPVLISFGSDVVPCMVRIAAGGELKVPVDTEREVKVTVTNRSNEESEAIVLPFRNGKKVESIGVSPWKFERKGRSQNRTFNDSLFSSSFIVDEVRIKVDKGSVYANVEQRGKFRKDFYNPGNMQNGSSVSPDKDLTIQITGENPFGSETKGNLIIKSKGSNQPEKVPFVIKNNESKTWKYPAERMISDVDIITSQLGGGARISLIQPSPREIDVQEFVIEPGQIKRDVDKERDLAVILNASGEPVTGKMRLERADRFSSDVQISLAAGETKTWTFPKKEQTVEIRFEIISGSAKAKIDQSKRPLTFQKAAGLKPAPKIAGTTPSKKEQTRKLMKFINTNDVAAMEAEIANGMDINSMLHGRTLLMKAANIGTADMVTMLISQGADVKYTTEDGSTALLAALDNHTHWEEITPALVSAGADVNAMIKRDGYTPLWKAVGRISKKKRDDAVKTIKLLLSKGADVNAPMASKNPKFDGYTLLMNVSAKGYTDMVELFLAHGADVNARTKEGKIALDFAREKGHQEVVELLIAKGAKAPAPTAVKEKAKTAEVEPQASPSDRQKVIPEGEIPTYKGAKVRKSGTMGKRKMIDMESSASPEEIMNFYKTEMAKKGWSEKMAFAQEKMATLMMFKGNKVFRLTAGQRDGKTKINIMIAGE